jgi:hypothetical protein
MVTIRSRTTQLSIAVLLALGLASPTTANNEAIQQSNSNVFELQTASINSGVALIENVRAALLSSYVRNNGWAASTDALVVTGFIGNVVSGWGQPVVGSVIGGGNSYALNLSAPNEYVAQGIAARLGGSVSGTVVAVTVPVPASASITESSLARFSVPGDPTRNRMETDIDLNNYSLNNVLTINGSTANLNELNLINDLISSGSAQFSGSGSFGQSLNVGNNLTVGETVTAKRVVSDEVVTDSATFNGLTVNGSTDLNGLVRVNSLVSASSISGSEISATSKISAPVVSATTVDTKEVLTDAAIIRGPLTAESAQIVDLGVTTLVANAATIEGPFAVRGGSEFTGDAVFQQNVLIRGGLEVISVATVGEIKEGGQFLKDRYLGIDATAKNAEKLGNVDAARFARRDTVNTFTTTQNFNGTANFNGRVNANKEVWANGRRVIGADGSLYHKGQDLDSRFLGKNAKAADAYKSDYATNAGKLGNVDAAKFARRDTVNTFTTTQNFNGAVNFKSTANYTGRVNANNELWANGRRVIGTDGTLYFRGDNLDNRYLGRTAKAQNAYKSDYSTNAGKLNGLSSTSFARVDVPNVFNANQTFNNSVNVRALATLSSVYVSGAATFKGVTNFDNTANFNKSVAMKSGLSVSGGNLVVDATKDIKVGTVSFKDLANRLKAVEEKQGDGGSSGPEPGWKTIYNNSTGTKTVSTGDSYQFAQYKLSFKYLENGTTWKSINDQIRNAGQGVTVSATKSDSDSRKCGGDWYRASATAYVSYTIIPQVSFTVPADKYDTKTDGGTCARASATASISNVHITKFEVYYQ